jgi:hypothetical protein
MRGMFHKTSLGGSPGQILPAEDVLPMVSVLRRRPGASPARRPPTAHRLRETPADVGIPTESRIVFRAGILALR